MSRHKKYRLGWVVGYKLENVVGDNIFLVEENYNYRETVNGKVVVQTKHRTKIFDSAAEAQKRAELGWAQSVANFGDNAAPWFWRAYAYHTSTPRHAKGLPRWQPEDDLWHWIPPLQQVVELPPDPAAVTKALASVHPVPSVAE